MEEIRTKERKSREGMKDRVINESEWRKEMRKKKKE